MYLALLLLFLTVVISFSYFVGGIFLLTACGLVDQSLQGKEQVRGQTAASHPERPAKTTDAGPYTAPGVRSEPSEAELPAKDRPPDTSISLSYTMACGISFGVCLVAALANGGLLFLTHSGPRPLNVYYFWIAPPMTFAIAALLHTLLLQTTAQRGLLITLMLLVPWGAVALAIGIICYRPPPSSSLPPRNTPAVTIHVMPRGVSYAADEAGRG